MFANCSAVILTLAAGGTLYDAAVLGNLAAGIAVTQEGVVTVSNDEVLAELTSEHGPAKVKTLDQLTPIVERLKRDGKRVVFTSDWTGYCQIYQVEVPRFGSLPDVPR